MDKTRQGPGRVVKVLHPHEEHAGILRAHSRLPIVSHFLGGLPQQHYKPNPGTEYHSILINGFPEEFDKAPLQQPRPNAKKKF